MMKKIKFDLYNLILPDFSEFIHHLSYFCVRLFIDQLNETIRSFCSYR